jgi:hypothetical protein
MRNSELETLDDEMVDLEKQIQEQSQESDKEVVTEEKSEEEIPTEPKEEVEEEKIEEPEPEIKEEEKSPEEEGLILGKFKSNADLEKSYKELESKLGKDAEERRRIQQERDEAYRKNQEWQEWSKSQTSEDSFTDDDTGDPILNELQEVKTQLKTISDKEVANTKYNEAIQNMAVMYNKCAADKEEFPYFAELKDEMTTLAKDLEGQFPELAFNPNAIPQLYRMCEARKIKSDNESSTKKYGEMETENAKLKTEIKKLRKLSPEEEDAAFVEGGSSSDGNVDLESLPLAEQLEVLEAKIGRARK